MIADDHPLYAEGLKNLLQEEFDVVSVVFSGLEAVKEARKCKPDVVLMDINMPGMDGIAATREIVAEQPDIKVLMLTSFTETDVLFRAIRAGAGGYLLKIWRIPNSSLTLGTTEVRIHSPGLENQILMGFEGRRHQTAARDIALLNERQIEVLSCSPPLSMQKWANAFLERTDSEVPYG